MASAFPKPTPTDQASDFDTALGEIVEQVRDLERAARSRRTAVKQAREAEVEAQAALRELRRAVHKWHLAEVDSQVEPQRKDRARQAAWDGWTRLHDALASWARLSQPLDCWRRIDSYLMLMNETMSDGWEDEEIWSQN